MFNPYQTLGLGSSASKDEARAAYRKLAQKNHPDKGGDEEQFKRIKGAWESIDNGWIAESAPTPQRQYSPQQSSFTTRPTWRGPASQPEPAYTGTYTDPWSPQMARQPARRTYPQPYARSYAPPGPNVVAAYDPNQGVRTNVGDFIARVSMAEAYNGFICEVEVDGKKHRVSIPEGIPNGLRFTVPIADEGKEDVTVTTRFTQSAFGFKGIGEALRESVIVNSGPGQVYRTKDLTITLPILSKALAAGTTIEFEDFLGETIKLKVPAGHDIRQPLKVEGKGYVDWYASHSQSGDQRGDIYVTLNPTEIPAPTMIGG